MSFFSQLAARRVPQILGLYVAGTWMAIEIGDWLIEKFALPDNLTAYIFIGLAVMLPSVALVAWGHGAPGRDRWTSTEKAVIPLNLAAAAAALFFVGRGTSTVPPALPMEPTKMMTVVDETGESQSFEVSVGQFHKRLSVFFLANELPANDDGAPDDATWLTYGLPVLVAHDLNHETPLAGAATPFQDDSFKQTLQEKGFSDLRGAPRALEVRLARERNSAALLSGRLFRDADGKLMTEARLLDAEAGTVLFSEQIPSDDPLSAADAISQLVQNTMSLDPKGDRENDPVRDNYSANVEAIRIVVDAIRILELQNDYPAAAARVQEAIELDPSFADAYGRLANISFLNGDSGGAITALDRGLQHDYKLSTSSRFLYKARRYIYANEVDKGVQVLKLWSQIEPQNPTPFEILGMLLTLTGQHHDEAVDAMKKALALNPARDALLRSLSTVEQSRGEYVAAADYAQQYIEARPDDPMAHQVLANVYLAANDLERAEKAYMDAELLAADDLSVTLGLAALSVRRGELERARERIDSVLDRDLTPQQRVLALTSRTQLAQASGQIQLVLQTIDEIDEESQKYLPPLLRTIQVGMSRISARALRGDFDGSRAEIERARAELAPPFDGVLHIPTMNVDWQQGRHDDAMAALARAEQFARERADPSYEIIMEYARTYGVAHQQDVEATIRQAERATSLMNRSALNLDGSQLFSLELQVDIARLLYGVGAIDASRALIEQVLVRAPFLATAHLVLAQIGIDLENLDLARKSLTTALDVWSNADEDYVYYARARDLLAQLSP